MFLIGGRLRVNLDLDEEDTAVVCIQVLNIHIFRSELQIVGKWHGTLCKYYHSLDAAVPRIIKLGR